MPVTREQQTEIDHTRTGTQASRRPTVESLDEILFQVIPILDHGFIRVVDYMGDDSAIVQAARVSYGRGTKKISEDRGLIHYLMRHRHSTPFEMCEIKFHVKLPMFVARQWIRHRTANVNEYSARYSVLDREFYVPDPNVVRQSNEQRKLERALETGQPDLFGANKVAEVQSLATQSEANKQGREKPLPQAQAADTLKRIQDHGGTSYNLYGKLLNEKADGSPADPDRIGIARELARMVLPANIYTQWYWKTDLYNFMHFLSLRADSHAQYEIRVYAEAMLDVLRKWVPLTAEAFEQHRLHAKTLSKNALDVVRRRLKGEPVTLETSGLGKREWSELQAVLDGES